MDTENRQKKEPCKHDSLVGNTPYESQDRTFCHPRNGLEKIEAIKQSTGIANNNEAMSGFPIKELEKYDDREGAYIVEVSLRIIVELQLWVDEKMTNELCHFYVYNDRPCQQRLLSIKVNIGHLITKLLYHKPQLGDTVKTLYDKLVQKAKETDSYYKRLSELPYWNEKNFNPTEVKQDAESLRKKLLHIESMVYTELKKEKPTEIRQEIETVNTETVLTRAPKIAHASYEYATTTEVDLANSTDDEVYEWLKIKKAEGDNELTDCELPDCDTWKRQLRTARNFFGTQKHKPKAGRKSNAFDVKKDPDILKHISNQYTKPD